MHSLNADRQEFKSGAFTWVAPLALIVFVLALSWTGLFVVITDLVDAAARISINDTLHE